jgi:hypothetical protein
MQTAPAVFYEDTARHVTLATHKQAVERALLGQISAPATFRGTIYVGLFSSPVPQGRPMRCTKISSPGWYLFHDIPDGIYHLRAAAFPVAVDLHSSLLPGEKLLLGNNASPLVIRQGRVSGDPDLVLHSPRLTDPPPGDGIALAVNQQETVPGDWRPPAGARGVLALFSCFIGRCRRRERGS